MLLYILAVIGAVASVLLIYVVMFGIADFHGPYWLFYNLKDCGCLLLHRKHRVPHTEHGISQWDLSATWKGTKCGKCGRKVKFPDYGLRPS